jgi:hypothetical protein
MKSSYLFNPVKFLLYVPTGATFAMSTSKMQKMQCQLLGPLLTDPRKGYVGAQC